MYYPTIGSLISFSSFFSDRLPLIWSHQGNFGNIMLSETGHVYSIDSKIIPIDVDPKLYSDYVSKVKDLLGALYTSVDHEATQVLISLLTYDIFSSEMYAI